MKKLDKIKEIEVKMKEGDIQPNEEQKQKIASKLQVVAEIAEIKSYLDLYNANK